LAPLRGDAASGGALGAPCWPCGGRTSVPRALAAGAAPAARRAYGGGPAWTDAFAGGWGAPATGGPVRGTLFQQSPPGDFGAGGRRGPSPRVLGAMALLRNPQDLDGEGLGRAAAAAAREGFDDPQWWQALTARAMQLAPHLALHDASLVLNGMARARRTDRKLVEALLPRISSHLVYLTSAHLAMLASAIAKAEVHNAAFVAALTRELKARLMEFHSAMEITMVINASSKLRVTDEDLYRRFVTHVQNQMAHEAFHIRDVSVIVGALARVQCVDSATMTRFADCAVQTLPEATALELARLMHACMSVSCVVHDFFSACVLQSQEQALTMDPRGLSAAAFAFGQCFEVAEVAHLRYLRKIFRNIRLASVASLPLFLPREIVSLLRTYARWQITFECDQLRKVADRMRATAAQFDVENTVSACYSLGLLMQRNSARAGSGSVTEATWAIVGSSASVLMEPVWRAARHGELDGATLLRAVEAVVALRTADAALAAAVAAGVARRRWELDAPTCASLHELLAHAGVPTEEDLMQVLADAATAQP